MSHQPSQGGYKKSLELYGESPQALQWENYRAAAIRYKHLVKNINFDHKTVLDVGCGMGDLLPYIFAKGENFKYLGIDKVEEFIKIARKRYAGFEFKVVDLFAGDLKEKKFDVVLCCGALNAKVDDWLENRKHKIKTLFGLARETVAFNMAGGIDPPLNKVGGRVAYANIEDIMKFCKSLTTKVALDTSYNSKDFTVVLYK